MAVEATRSWGFAGCVVVGRVVTFLLEGALIGLCDLVVRVESIV